MKHNSRFHVYSSIVMVNQAMLEDDIRDEICQLINEDALTDEQLEMIWFANHSLLNSLNYRKRIFASICDSVKRELSKQERQK